MKKLLALLLILSLINTCLGFALAEETEQAPKPEIHTSGDYLYIILEDGTAEIRWYFGNAEELTVPDELDGIQVSRIGNSAFYSCDSLTSVTIPDGVTGIGTNPFGSCDKLTDIIVSIDHPYLAAIDGVLFSKPDKRLVCYPYAFTADSYVIPDGIQIIGVDAFCRCSSLTSITIPNSVARIGDEAFSWCTSLTSVNIPDSVTSIGANPFIRCDKLTDIIVSVDHPYLAVIDGVLFSKPDKRLVCYPDAFTADSYVIPDEIQIIGDDAFFNCASLTSVTIPDSVTGIGSWVFSYCASLTSVTIPGSVTGIGNYAFYCCDSLASVTIPDSVTGIGENAFTGCDSLTSVIIPDSVTNIGDYAFSYCESLTSVTIPASVISIGESAFAVYQDDKYIPIPSLTATVPRDSYAAQYCKDNGIRYTYPDANDWLNN